MGFRNHFIQLSLLLVLLVLSSVTLGWALSVSRMHLAILLALGIIVETVFLFNRLARSQREILFFFRALENEDTSLIYRSSHRSRFIHEMHQHLNRINGLFQKMKLEQERREQYFSRILEHISSGLMVISPTGHINQINQEALRLLNVQQLTHIRALNQSNPRIYDEIRHLKSLGRSESSWLDNTTGQKQVLGMQMVEINLDGEDVRVVTLQDISAGMERKEIEDWIGLIRIMSHEIMNSLSPITSISTTLKEVWSEHENNTDPSVVPEGVIRQTLKGLDAIAEQSEGLTTFFESYRVLSRIPDAVKKEVGVCSLLEKVEILADHYREDGRLNLSFRCPDRGLKIVADEQMMKQVLMNLLKNAIQAVDGTDPAEISVEAAEEGNRIVFRVTDNGEGIPQDLADKIFMPFFTTRKKGTGVGLSYSRQVVAMNGGRMEFESCPGRTQFRLVF